MHVHLPEPVVSPSVGGVHPAFSGITLSRVSGHGGEQEVVGHHRGTRVMVEFHGTGEVRRAVSEPVVPSLERVIRIRTGEQDTAALTPVTETGLRPGPRP